MEISIKRDGLTLRGDMRKPDLEKCPVAIIFHGLMSSRTVDDANMFDMIADKCVERGIAAVKFDFNGHGDSDGEFCDMNVYSEILDAAKVLDYVRSLPFVTDIYIAGHSQGALVGGMLAGYYCEKVKKLAMLAPAATIKDDALIGSCFGTPYDRVNVPDYFPMKNVRGEHFDLGGLYFRIARTLPIYETTSMFKGKTLIVHGTADAAVGVVGAQRYTECMPNAELVLIEGEEHGFNKFSLDRVTTMVADFFAEE